MIYFHRIICTWICLGIYWYWNILSIDIPHFLMLFKLSLQFVHKVKNDNSYWVLISRLTGHHYLHQSDQKENLRTEKTSGVDKQWLQVLQNAAWFWPWTEVNMPITLLTVRIWTQLSFSEYFHVYTNCGAGLPAAWYTNMCVLYYIVLSSPFHSLRYSGFRMLIRVYHNAYTLNYLWHCWLPAELVPVYRYQLRSCGQQKVWPVNVGM